MEHPDQIESAPEDKRRSSFEKQSPHLSHHRLTLILVLMCATPVITIFTLWSFLPPVFENELQASVYTEGTPKDAFYEAAFEDRPEFVGGFLIVQNNSEDEWTNLHIRLNHHYSIYDNEPISGNSEKRYELSKFLTKSGARFSLKYNKVKSVRVYARRPTADRATFYHEFE